MRSEELVANEVLAFLQYQLDVMDEVSVTQICTSNFTEEEIRSAKKLLYESLQMADRMPTRRRDEKGERSLQDTIRLLKETDPDDVPTFVAKDLRKLPPVTFDHVDVTRLLKDITSMRSSLVELQLKLEASQSTICDLRSEVAELRNSVCRSHAHANSDNTRHGQVNASPQCAESAKLHSSPAVATTSDASPCPALPASPAFGTPTNVSTSRLGRVYSDAVKRDPVQRPPKANVAIQNQPEGTRGTVQSVPCKGKADADGFVKVERRKKKPSSRNQCGTALTGPNMLLRPAIPTTQLYVSRLHHSTKVEEIVEYIRVKTNWTLRVERLEPRHNTNFKSFVVRVPTQHLDMFQEAFWPKGVVFRRFRGRLRDTTQCNTTPPIRVNK
ncbi:uncharacterized protein LOC124632796 [Helicoverpa zea]|uniref:uncharacterized protein LOC124632796 n=1 Tax=Helicoverpa zea TaxID=7113 RepID=UPI001F5AE46D|nr:uncharacterized protein LOC124632796 [Helicoverpa zea]